MCVERHRIFALVSFSSVNDLRKTGMVWRICIDKELGESGFEHGPRGRFPEALRTQLSPQLMSIIPLDTNYLSVSIWCLLSHSAFLRHTRLPCVCSDRLDMFLPGNHSLDALLPYTLPNIPKLPHHALRKRSQTNINTTPTPTTYHSPTTTTSLLPHNLQHSTTANIRSDGFLLN